MAGGGIDGTKTINMSRAIDLDWTTSDGVTVDSDNSDVISELETAIQRSVQQNEKEVADAKLWWQLIPAALVLVAVGLLLSAAWDKRKQRKEEQEARTAAAA